MVVAVVCVLLDSCSRLAWARARVSLDTLKTEKRQQLLNCKRRGCGESTVADVMCETCRCHAGPRESFPTCYNQNEDHEGKPGKETTEEHCVFFGGSNTRFSLYQRLIVFFLEVFRMILNSTTIMFNKNIIETNCCNTNRIADIDDNQAAKELNRNCPDFNSYAAL